jgi:uncharacterized protein YndB with AHSA1/START domain
MADETLPPEDSLFIINRTFNAPRDLVWQAYAKLEHLEKWWGPKGFEWLHGSLDFKPGGKFHYGMKAPTGMEMWGRFVYREIEAPKKLTFVVSFSDRDGGIAAPPIPGMEKYPREVLNILTFTEEDGKTKLHMRGGPINATPENVEFFKGMKTSMNQGFAGTFAQLDDYLVRMKD